jgi:hypothetical protein
MNIVDKILVDPITRGLKFFTKGGVVVGPASQSIKLYAAGSTYSFISVNSVGTTVDPTIAGDPVCLFTKSALTLTAQRKCVVNIDWSIFATNSLTRNYISKNGALTSDAVQFSQRNFQANDAVLVATSLVLVQGDFLKFCLDSGNVRNSADIAFLNITCQAF